MKILIAEDDPDMARAVSALLTRSSYSTEIADNGKDALELLQGGDFDGAILDIMMPEMSGLQVLEALRREGNQVPVLLLTAMGEVDDRIRGLDAGADDYLPKPFDGGELLARLRALMRRRDTYTPDLLTAGDLVLDRSSYQLICGDSRVSLNHKSFQVMEMLMLGHGRIISVNEFMEHIWGWDSEAEINVVWVNISFLRKQLQKIGSEARIRTVRSAGYQLEAVLD